MNRAQIPGERKGAALLAVDDTVYTPLEKREGLDDTPKQDQDGDRQPEEVKAEIAVKKAKAK